jgi:trehalose 6-phosphate phosphatase
MATQSSSLPPSSLRSLPGIGSQTALFLDFDGTLADLAPQPEAVQVAAELIPVLTQLAAQLGGALAIVSGRKLTDLDGFLAPLQLPAAAEHGAQRRLPQGEVIRLASPDLQEVVRLATALAARHAGLRVEIKAAAVALHYRHAPEMETLALQVMLDAAHGTPGVELLHGKYVFEVKPAGISKGTAIEAFMAEAPFAGRLPLFAGDDTTDEAGFSAVQLLGGQGIKVGEGATLANYRCATPDALRQWLQVACQDRGPKPAPNKQKKKSMARIRT